MGSAGVCGARFQVSSSHPSAISLWFQIFMVHSRIFLFWEFQFALERKLYRDTHTNTKSPVSTKHINRAPSATRIKVPEISESICKQNPEEILFYSYSSCLVLKWCLMIQHCGKFIWAGLSGTWLLLLALLEGIWKRHILERNQRASFKQVAKAH